MASLFDSQPFVQSVAEVIAAALRVETEIVDDEGRVLGATGRIRSQLLTKRTDTFINHFVMEKAMPFVLLNPGCHKLCEPCEEKNDCFYTSGLFYPIQVGKKCYGVISLVSFDMKQKKILIQNQNSFLDFIGKMAELLAIKLSESTMMEEICMNNEYLEAIINSVNEGIISCNGQGIITCFNRTAEKSFKAAKENVIGQPISSILPESILIKALQNQEPFHQEKVHYKDSLGETVNLISSATIVKNNGQIVGAVESFSEEEKLFRMVHSLSNSEIDSACDNIIGTSAAISNLKRLVTKVAQNVSTVLITGESGTGKELFARAIHSSSNRSKQPFVAINCGAIPESLLESELFGYEKGAFTGAKNEGKPGKFELANGGTLFLDEIGDMPLHLQVKLLRVLQERVIQKIGGTKNIPINVRVIAATHQDLRAMIGQRLFREDLFYRLNVIPLHLPPLRERVEDIPLILDFLCQKYADLMHKEIKGFSEKALRILTGYQWPGNVREMENAVEYAISFCSSTEMIKEEYLPQWLYAREIPAHNSNYKQKIEKSEKQVLLEAIQEYGDSVEGKMEIAENMGISLSTLYRLFRKYKLINTRPRKEKQ
ncbi:sigma-54 interaction domain-containing protein [Candidatus Formimonas warabiya]|uniref:Sigma-54 factor interaction domain-containing protein n=1 Tax=Formimonas warabiya TaxID=1761012 RepID=A0A3G1KW65_FORW1|nr:sigma 54-interacting transcriptional regulator [Candidatus Formimonas warabiya]ATW26783.1 hypothetical protein DCMF_20235 [Candidatus Formimonas warabiya]